jgi:hypothetical protein
MTITIPNLSLVVLIGPSVSGKSTSGPRTGGSDRAAVVAGSDGERRLSRRPARTGHRVGPIGQPNAATGQPAPDARGADEVPLPESHVRIEGRIDLLITRDEPLNACGAAWNPPRE